MHEDLDGIFEELKEERAQSSKKRIVILGFCGLGVMIYLFFLLFGSNSWSVLLELKKEKISLENQAENLQKENVVLQKRIFELKGLEPLSEEKK